MWQNVLDLVYSAVVSAFGWFQQILDAAPGAWNTIFTIFVIFALSRFLLGPLLGVTFSGQSDQAQVKDTAKRYRKDMAAKRYNHDRGHKQK